MTGLLRKIMPVVPSSSKHGGDDDDDAHNVEYSFAIEYSGPPIGYDIPRAVPIAVDEIPVAAPVVSSSLLKDSSLPVIQPIKKSTPVGRKPSREPKLSSESSISSSSLTSSGASSTGPNMSRVVPTQVDSIGASGCLTGNYCKVKSSEGRRSSGRLKSLDSQCNSCESLDCVIGVESTPKLSGLIGASGKLERPDCHDNMHLSVELPDDSRGEADVGFQDYMNPGNSESTGSGSSSHAVSSEAFSSKEEDLNEEETPCHAKRPSVVTFRDPDPSDVVKKYSEVESNQPRPQAERPGKKGSCYRCLKGNRFIEKEVCIVCGAKYCSNCLLRAMGSMPEGRKCVTCIGFSIDDAKRGTLGRASRMLRRLLTEMEVKRIMGSEISCPANQLPPERVSVNGEALSEEKLHILRSCPNPPKKLNPGHYWYDKVSGFWGKVGQEPCQIISPQLNVGGQIDRKASNGNTDILINNREITKKELLMLKLARVQCEGKPHFWLSADGSYQEEGMKQIKGHMWSNSTIKVICALLSLPTPPDCVDSGGDELNGANPSYPEHKALCKLLLLGDTKSGTSTIYKQAKVLFNVPFSEDERQNIKVMIQSNLYRYIGIVLEGRERFEEECMIERRKKLVIDQPGPSGQMDEKTLYSISPKLKAFSDWLLKVIASDNLEVIFPAATREYAPFVEELSKDAAFQATYLRRNELDLLPSVATYFLERAVEISRTTYEPSDLDILYAEGITSSNGLSCMEFLFPKPPHQSSIESEYQNYDSSLRHQLIRVRPRNLGENCKWLGMFEDVDIVLFCVSLTDYDEFFEDKNGVLTNKMLASRQLFEKIITHPTFKDKTFLLLLNKFDILEEKLEQSPLTKCEWFRDFNPVISHNYHSSSRRNNNAPRAQYAFHYIALQFKRLFNSLTDHKLFVSLVTGLEQETVDEALRYAREILNWDEEQCNYTNNESSYDFEASSSS
ncbi:hypothetical protein Patl1_36284 [Pistacia atlantica]|nr:hypothetical protein Patl1_36284 [Pistacia atlantica]